MASFGLGAVPGALMAASSKPEPSGARIRVLALLTGTSIVATALTPVVAGAFIGMAIAGFLSIWLVATANTLVQLRSQPQLRGRIMGIWTMALPGGYPVSALLVALVAGANARAGFAFAGIAMLVVAVATWTSLGPAHGLRQKGPHDPLVPGRDPGPHGAGDDVPLLDEGGEQHSARLAPEEQFARQPKARAGAEQDEVRGAAPYFPAEHTAARPG
jgi:MFS family permease